MDEFKALGDQMIADGLVPARLRRLRWLAGHGHVRHPEHAHERLRLPHRPHGGRENGPTRASRRSSRCGATTSCRTRRKVRRPHVAGCRQGCSVDKTAGMYFLGTFAAEQRRRSQEDIDALYADIDFFPWPAVGSTEFDAENAIDAPIDGFMLSANPREPRGRQGLPEVRGHAEAPLAYVLTPSLSSVAVSPQAPIPSGYNPFQAASAEVAQERRLHRPVPRSRRTRRLRRAVRHAGLPAQTS